MVPPAQCAPAYTWRPAIVSESGRPVTASLRGLPGGYGGTTASQVGATPSSLSAHSPVRPRASARGRHGWPFSRAAATTGVGAFAVLLTPHRLLPFTLDIDAWAAQGESYVRTHIRASIWTVALILVVAVLIAAGLYWLRARRKPAEFRSQGNVWVHSPGDRPADKVPYVGLHLDDGRLIEGPLRLYTLDEEDGRRDLALARPIRITLVNEAEPHALPNLDRLNPGATRGPADRLGGQLPPAGRGRLVERAGARPGHRHRPAQRRAGGPDPAARRPGDPGPGAPPARRREQRRTAARSGRLASTRLHRPGPVPSAE